MACSIVYRVPWAIKAFVKISRGGACGGGAFLDWNFTFDNRVLFVSIDYFLYREIREKQFLSLEIHWYWGTWIIHQARKGLVRNYECSKDFFTWDAWTSMRCSWLTSFWCLSFDELSGPSLSPPSLHIWENWWKWDVLCCGTGWKVRQTDHQPHSCSQLNQPITPLSLLFQAVADPHLSLLLFHRRHHRLGSKAFISSVVGFITSLKSD